MQQAQLELNENLAEAVSLGDVVLCRSYIEQGADVNWTVEGAAPPIHWAAFYGNVEVIELLLSAGADVNAAEVSAGHSNGKRALSWAIQRQQPLSTIALLLGAGADPNYVTSRFDSPLLDAVTSGTFELVKLLVQHGARSSLMPDQPGVDTLTAFQTAVFRGLNKEVELFVRSCGENVDQRTSSGKAMPELAGPSTRTRDLLRALRSETSIANAISDAGSVETAEVPSRSLSPTL
jgi:ankyrin repeat protein